MKDVLVIVAISTPALIGLAVFAWGLISLLAGSVVGRAIRHGDRPYDHATDDVWRDVA